jgi:hypothetical protein
MRETFQVTRIAEKRKKPGEKVEEGESWQWKAPVKEEEREWLGEGGLVRVSVGFD